MTTHTKLRYSVVGEFGTRYYGDQIQVYRTFDTEEEAVSLIERIAAQQKWTKADLQKNRGQYIHDVGGLEMLHIIKTYVLPQHYVAEEFRRKRREELHKRAVEHDKKEKLKAEVLRKAGLEP